MADPQELLLALFRVNDHWWEYDANWCIVCDAELRPWPPGEEIGAIDHTRHEAGCPVPAMIEWYRGALADAVAGA